MTTATYEGVPSLSTFLAMKLNNRIARARSKEREGITRTWVQSFIRLMLHLVGFAALTMAGFSWNMTAGLIVGGMSCFVLAWLMNASTAPNSSPVSQHDPMATRR